MADHHGDRVDVYVLTERNISAMALGHFVVQGFNSSFYTRLSGAGGGIGVIIRDSWITTQAPVNFCYADSVECSKIITVL